MVDSYPNILVHSAKCYYYSIVFIELLYTLVEKIANHDCAIIIIQTELQGKENEMSQFAIVSLGPPPDYSLK